MRLFCRKPAGRKRTADEALQNLRQQFAAANAEHSSLSTQLEEIRGGICPFLKEKCRQFDPSKVEGDLRQKKATMDVPSKQHRVGRINALCGEKRTRTAGAGREEIWRGRAANWN